MKRARILAFFLDALVCAASADAAGLAATALLWAVVPGGRVAIPWVWGVAGAAALWAFLMRDASGGRARRWLGLEAVHRDGGTPGGRASIRRNLALLLPFWNIYEAWPVLRDGTAMRPSDRRSGVRIRRID